MLTIQNIHKIQNKTIIIPGYLVIYSIQQPVIETNAYRFPINVFGNAGIKSGEFYLWRTQVSTAGHYQLDFRYDGGNTMTTMIKANELDLNSLLKHFEESLTPVTKITADPMAPPF
jgi:hypothetical protein